MPDPNRELTERRPEEITTLHISKLPDDFKERELFLLYGSMPGFQNGQIAYAAPGRTLGFATFNNRENASGALEKTNGLSWTGAPPEFDLRVGFASSQSRNIKTDQSVSSSRSPVKPDVAGWQQIDNRVISIPHYPQPAYHSLTTLFVRSISEHMTNTQLKSLFQRYGEVSRLTKTGTKAWICYTNSTAANNALQMNGYMDGHSQPTALHVSFAKAEMRTRHDPHDPLGSLHTMH